MHRDTGAAEEFGEPKLYPFNVENVLPWWSRIGELSDEEEAA